MTLFLLTTKLGDFYVLSNSATEAQSFLIRSFNSAEYGYYGDRQVSNIKILANEIHNFPSNKPNFSSGDNLLVDNILKISEKITHD